MSEPWNPDDGWAWIEEHMDQLFCFNEEPKQALFYGTDEEFEDWLERLRNVADGGEALPRRAPRPRTGGIMGAIQDHLESES